MMQYTRREAVEKMAVSWNCALMLFSRGAKMRVAISLYWPSGQVYLWSQTGCEAGARGGLPNPNPNPNPSPLLMAAPPHAAASALSVVLALVHLRRLVAAAADEDGRHELQGGRNEGDQQHLRHAAVRVTLHLVPAPDAEPVVDLGAARQRVR